MKLLNKKAGFTLIEIIVVLIIVGILAAIALPNLFRNIARSRSAEALTILTTIKAQVEGCIQSQTDLSNCIMPDSPGSPSTGGVTNPGGSNFVYTMPDQPTSADVTDQVWSIEAQSVSNSTDTITLTRSAGGVITCTGTGNFTGVCS